MRRTFTFSLGEKSINATINKLKKIKESLPIARDYMLNEFATKIIETANTYIASSGLDEIIISALQNSWEYSVMDGSLEIENVYANAAAYEFGVGIVAEESGGYPIDFNPDQTYLYNVPTQYKRSDGSWIFYLQDVSYPVDIKPQYIISEKVHNNGTISIKTRGQPAALFLYNALMDFVDQKKFVDIAKEKIKEALK